MSYSWLPPLLSEIADVAGVNAALAIADARGGERVTIPAKVKPGHWLVQVVGMEAAEKISAHYRIGYGGTGGASLTLPLGPASNPSQIRRRLDQMILDGVSADKIARVLRVHRTTVFRRKALLEAKPEAAEGPLKPDDRQLDLFD